MRLLDDVVAIRHIPLMADDDSVTFFKAMYSFSRPRIPAIAMPSDTSFCAMVPRLDEAKGTCRRTQRKTLLRQVSICGHPPMEQLIVD